MWGPLAKGLTVSNNLDHSDRPTALEQLGVLRAANGRLVSLTKEYVTVEREIALLVAAQGLASACGPYGLTPMSPLDRTARRRPATGEAEKAAREVLQRTVRIAAALAHDDAVFLDRLRDAGLRVRERHGDDGTLVGYSVALPGDRADRGRRPLTGRAHAGRRPSPWRRPAPLRPAGSRPTRSGSSSTLPRWRSRTRRC